MFSYILRRLLYAVPILFGVMLITFLLFFVVQPPRARAQAVLGDGSLVHDFMFADTPRTVHVLNAPSPAATAALPIARVIAARVLREPE